ncbi:MAG: hypothetical protein HOM55_11230 [Proteobacteria bacterium]|jgi:hypothetical protein|nr:hypothetical protein [Pseudomonadota bacterium]
MINELNECWDAAYRNILPIAHQFKDRFADRWVRFHTLPWSKRYAENDTENQIILQRHNALLSAISGRDFPLFLITTGFNETGDAERLNEKLVEADPSAQLWKSIAMHENDDGSYDVPEYKNYWHLFVSKWRWANGIFDPILRLVAVDHISNVMIVNPAKHCWYHPYDGGADIVLSSTFQRDRLKAEHTQWLSDQLNGL